MIFYAFLAFVPIISALIGMVILRLPAMRVMPVAALIVCILAYFVWGISFHTLFALMLEGLITSSAILIVIFGALIFYYTMLASGAIETMQSGMMKISPDRRVQVLIIGFLFTTFLEGASGFGAPQALASSLLVGLGFPPVCAAVMCLALNGMAVSFGSAGTGISLGLKPMEAITVPALEVSHYTDFLAQLTQYVTLFHSTMIFIMPIFMLGFMTRIYGKNKSWKEGFVLWRYSLMASCCLAIPYIFLGLFTGPEMPSLLGGLIGLGFLIYFTKKGVFSPKELWDFDKKENWDKEWSPVLFLDNSKNLEESFESPIFKENMSQFMAWLPYFICTLMLIVTRIPFFGISTYIYSDFFNIGATNILGVSGVGTHYNILLLPGVLPFLPVSLVAILLYGMYKKSPVTQKRDNLHKVKEAWINAFGKMKNLSIAICSTVILVSIFKGTGLTEIILDANAKPVSMPMAMALFIGSLTGNAWVFISAYMGGLGAFVTGSNMISNMLFSEFQWNVATTLAYNVKQHMIILATQVTGGGMGTMISIQNIISVCVVLGLTKHEGKILKQAIVPFLIYGIPVGIFAFILLESSMF